MSGKIPCSNGSEVAYAIVDDDDCIKLQRFSWHLTNGYPSRKHEGKCIYMHHDVIGKPTSGFVTDHINRIKLDNQKNNLRHVTQSENLYNSAQNLSEDRYIYKHRCRYQVKPTVNGKSVFIGSFPSYEEAKIARDNFLTKTFALES